MALDDHPHRLIDLREAAIAGADEDAGAGPVLAIEVELRIVDRHLGGAHRVLAEPGHPAGLFAIDELGRVVATNLTGDLRRVARRIGQRHRANPRAAGHQSLPELFGGIAERRDRAETGDDDSPSGANMISHYE